MLLHLFRAGSSYSTSHPLLVLPVLLTAPTLPRRPRTASHPTPAQLALVAISRDSGRTLPCAIGLPRRTRHLPCTPDTSASTLPAPTIPVVARAAAQCTSQALISARDFSTRTRARPSPPPSCRDGVHSGGGLQEPVQVGRRCHPGASAAIAALGSYRIRDTDIDGPRSASSSLPHGCHPRVLLPCTRASPLPLPFPTPSSRLQ